MLICILLCGLPSTNCPLHRRCSAALAPIVQQLLACGEALLAAPAALPAIYQFETALHLAVVLYNCWLWLPLGPAEAAVMNRCVNLLLGAGRKFLQQAAGGCPYGQLTGSPVLQGMLMRCLTDASARAGIQSQLASQAAPPRRMTSWLLEFIRFCDTGPALTDGLPNVVVAA